MAITNRSAHSGQPKNLRLDKRSRKEKRGVSRAYFCQGTRLPSAMSLRLILFDFYHMIQRCTRLFWAKSHPQTIPCLSFSRWLFLPLLFIVCGDPKGIQTTSIVDLTNKKEIKKKKPTKLQEKH